MIFSWKKIKVLNNWFGKYVYQSEEKSLEQDSDLNLSELNLEAFNTIETEPLDTNEQIDELLEKFETVLKDKELDKAAYAVTNNKDNGDDYIEEEVLLKTFNNKTDTSENQLKQDLRLVLDTYFHQPKIILNKDILLKKIDLNLFRDEFCVWNRVFKYLSPCFRSLNQESIYFTLGMAQNTPVLCFEIGFEEKSRNFIALFFRILKSYLNPKVLDTFGQDILVSYTNAKLQIKITSKSLNNTKKENTAWRENNA